MILMCETNEFKDKEYRPAYECMNVINDLYGLHLDKSYLKDIHEILKSCKWIQNKQVKLKDGKSSTAYFIGSLRKFDNTNNAYLWSNEEDDYRFDKQYVELGEKLEKLLGIEIFETIPNVPQESDDTEQEWPSAPQSDESDMEKCSQALIDKYQFESKKTIKITEEQLKRLKHLLQ